MHKKVPAEKASAPAVKDDAELEPSPPIPDREQGHSAGIISPKPKIHDEVPTSETIPRGA